MKTNVSKSGQSLVELLCAIAVFTIGVVVIGYLILDAQIALRQHVEYTKARLLAHECMEALRTVRDDSFEKLTSGVHGFDLINGVFVITEEPVVLGKFTRSLSVDDIDSETKRVSCTILWEITSARAGNITLSTYLTDWKQTNGNAGDIAVDISDSLLFASSTGLGGITLLNQSSASISLSSISAAWNGNAKLEFISISGTTVFSASSTLGVTSGTSIDISEYELVSNVVVPIDVFGFSESVEGTDFIITFIFQDGTKRFVLIEG